MTNLTFQKNIGLLSKKDKLLANRLLSIEPTKTYSVSAAKVNGYTLSVFGDDGMERLLHSKYNPEKEAQKQIEMFDYKPTADLVCLGFAFGYHVNELLKREANRSFLLIVEKDLAIIKAAFQTFDFETILNDPKVFFSIDDPPARLFTRLKKYSFSILGNGLKIFEHQASLQVYPDYYTEVKKILSEIYTWAKVNFNTQLSKAEAFAGNSIDNFINVVKSSGVKKLFKKFNNAPAFIVSAGPSLDKNIHYLKQVGDKGLIIVVDSALKNVLDNNIVPDLIVSIDFGRHNLKYLQGIDTKDLALVFDPEVHPAIPENFKGKRFAINLAGKSVCDWFSREVSDKGALEKGLSVSHTAFLLAQAMGASPIIFLGQDLSYPRGAWHNKSSSIYQKADIHDELKKRLQNVSGYFGGEVLSETSLKVFINHFESIFSQHAGAYFNATEGGAHINGLEKISLREAIFSFCKKPVDKIPITLDCPNECDMELKKLLNAALLIEHKLRECYSGAKKAYKMINLFLDEIIKGEVKSDDFLRRYSEITQIVKQVGSDNQVLAVMKDNAIQALMVRETRSMVKIDNDIFKKPNELKNILLKEKLFFESIVSASGFLADKYGSLVDNLRLMKSNVSGLPRRANSSG